MNGRMSKRIRKFARGRKFYQKLKKLYYSLGNKEFFNQIRKVEKKNAC